MSPLQRQIIILYTVYAVSGILLLGDWVSATIGTLAGAFAYSAGNRREKAAKDTPYASHVCWLSRTFWIGSLVYTLGMIAGGLATMGAVDFSSLSAAVAAGDDPEAALTQLQGFAEREGGKADMINLVSMIPPTIWWLHRCWRGFALAKAGKPVENVTTWL